VYALPGGVGRGRLYTLTLLSWLLPCLYGDFSQLPGKWRAVRQHIFLSHSARSYDLACGCVLQVVRQVWVDQVGLDEWVVA